MKSNILKRIINLSKKIHSSSRGSHDWDHTQRVYRLAEHIAKKQKADLATVRLAAALHDIARGIEDASGGRIDHAKKGAEMAVKMLKKEGFDAAACAAVGHCIASHRFRGTDRPATPEAKCLFDADKLDSIGAVGIGRAFLFAGEVGARLHNSDTDVLRTKPYTKDDTAYREYMVKLRHVRARMQTKEGKRLARERHAFMEEFFRRIELEIKGDL